MKYRFLRTLQLRLAVLDILMINIVFLAIQFLFLKYMHKRPNAEYMYFIFFLNAVWISIAWLVSSGSDGCGDVISTHLAMGQFHRMDPGGRPASCI